MSLHLVIGFGPAGAATARLLASQGHTVKVVSRTERPAEAGLEHVTLDATSTEELIKVAQGAVAIYNCVGLPYHRWATDLPPLTKSVNAAAEATGAVLVVLSNLYGYGAVDGAITEQLPLAAEGVKGKLRAQLWREALELHNTGRIRMAEVRASDFFGPGVTDGGHLAARVVPQLFSGRPIQVVGDPDAPHSWTYIDDVARAMVTVAAEEKAWGHAWHVPTAEPQSTRAMVEKMAHYAEVKTVPVRPVPPLVFRILGLFSPLMRELREIRYQFDRPFVVDSSKYSAEFDQRPTPIDEQIKSTVDWWRNRESANGAQDLPAAK